VSNKKGKEDAKHEQPQQIQLEINLGMFSILIASVFTTTYMRNATERNNEF